MQYDHRQHAGNAGDVWKHFILTEVLERLLAKGKICTYVESHVGYPEYSLGTPGEWSGGIGRCWQRLPLLEEFCLFKLLEEINGYRLKTYLGSASLALKMAERHRVPITAEGWDTHPCVAEAWASRPGLRFHQGDGFPGVIGLIGRSDPSLLLIDPPYLEAGDARRAADLLDTAVEAGWIVLWWQMMGAETLSQASCSMSKFSLEFQEAGLDGGRWKGATMAIAGANPDLVEHIRLRAANFLDFIQI